MLFSRLGYVGLALAVLATATVGAIYIIGGILSTTADFRGEVDKREKVVADGDYRIAAYDEFYKLCSSIQSQNDQIENQKALIKATSDPDQKEVYRAGLVAHQNTKAELIREYNAKAAAEGTRGQFRDSELPYEIDPDQEEVSCGSAS